MEHWLTKPASEYEQYLRGEAGFPLKEVQADEFRYNQIGDLLVRSQIDCKDPELPRKVFDIKTRSNLQSRIGFSKVK
jgi:hypothetical protein